MRKYIAYYRVSTSRQGKSGLGLEAQQAAVKEYLNGKGWPPTDEFIEVESGKKNDRPELDKALASCRVHKATLVIAKLDRLARNAAFLLNLRDAGVDFVACDMPDANRLTVGIMALVAEDEAERISARTKAALKAKVERDGQWDRRSKHHLVPGIGQAKASDAARQKALNRAKDLQPILLRIQEHGVHTLRGIAKALNDEGIPTPRGGQWKPQQVKRLIAQTNEV